VKGWSSVGNILGIDFGTTNVSASLIQDDGKEIALRLGKPVRPEIMRSAVLFLPSGELVAGDLAPDEYQRWLDEQHGGSFTLGSGRPRLLEAFKPLLAERTRGKTVWEKVTKPGRLADHPVDEGTTRLGRTDRFVLHTEVLCPRNCPKDFGMVEIRKAAVAILQAVKAKLDKEYGKMALDRVVLGVPVGFSDIGREKLIEAVEEAGLASRSRVSLLHEPLAVALTYGIEARTPKRVLVFDNGGGTVDMTVLDIEGHPDGEFRYRVLGQTPHPRAGRYYDRLLFKRIVDQAGTNREVILGHLGARDPLEVQDPLVLDAVERVKERLFAAGAAAEPAYGRRRRSSTTPSEEQGYPFTYPFGKLSFRQVVRPEDFTEAIGDELRTLESKLRALLAEVAEKTGSALSGDAPAGMDEVLMAGGSSQLPCMTELILRVVPGVAVNSAYAGSRTTTAGFARAAQYRRLIEELTDSTYGLLDPNDDHVEAVVAPSIPVAETSLEARAGQEDGYYIQPVGTAVTLLLVSRWHERWRPYLCIRASGVKPDDVLQVVVEIDRETGRPVPRVISCSTGEELDVEVTTDLTHLAMLEEGQIIKYRDNQMPQYLLEGVGCIEAMARISSGKTLEFATGDMRKYRLYLSAPDNSLVKVIADNDSIEFVDLELPNPGEQIDLKYVDPRVLKPLPEALPLEGFTRTGRPPTVKVAVAQGSSDTRTGTEAASPD